MAPELDSLEAALADRYQIERELGRGGMATVYLAKDLRHERQVAIKVLMPDLAALVGADRFLTEIKTTANFQHPHILPLFDSGEADGLLFYVMPYVQGESLREKLDRERQLPVEEAVRIATEIAEALEYAHGHGIIHRDIKPANILLHDGRVLVADFGIALALTAAGGDRLTETGTSLGTPHYMSPEQATADPGITGMSDLYSLGAVLYEMLTGDPPHTGPNAQVVLTRILTEEPRSVHEIRRSVPVNVVSVVTRSLEKAAADRFPSGSEMAGALANPSFRWPIEPGTAAGSRLAVGGYALAAIMTVVAVWSWSSTDRGVDLSDMTAATVMRRATNYGGGERAAAIAPGGRSFAFVSDHGGTADIYARQVSGGDLVRLTDDSALEQGLVYAPDGETIYFERRDLGGGPPSIWQVPALGGPSRRVVDGGIRGAPSPDGRSLAYLVPESGNLFRAEILTLAGSEVRPLVGGISNNSMHLAWSPDGSRIAYTQAELFGPANVILVDVRSGATTSATHFTESEEGIFGDIAWLPDNRHMLVSYVPPGSSVLQNDLGILDVDTGEVHRLTLTEGTRFPVVSVSSDGARAVVSRSTQEREMWRVPYGPDPAANAREATRIFGPTYDPRWVFPSHRQDVLLFNSPATGRNLWIADLDGGSAPRQVTALSDHDISHSALSPDGTQLAFVSQFGGQSDIWIQNVDGSGLRRRTNDSYPNSWPVWSPDGEKIAFSSDREDGLETWVVGAIEGSPEKVRDGFLRGDWAAQTDGTGTWLVTSNPGGTISLIDFETREEIWRTETNASLALPVFSPDRTSVSVVAGPNQDEIRVIDVATGVPSTAVKFPDPFFMLFRVGWASDGGSFIVNRRRLTSDIVLLDSFWRAADASGAN